MVYSNEPLSSTKTSVKWLEVPIQKFNTAVSHFVQILKDHNNNIKKLKRLNQLDEMQKEYESASRTVNQLTSLLGEMDNLRTQVVVTDVSKFDKLINNSKQSALSVIQSHQALRAQLRPVRINHDQDLQVMDNIEQEKNLHVMADLAEETKKQEKLAASMEQVQEDVQNINQLFQDLSQLVHEQGESCNKIEDQVETAHQNVVEGESMLCRAARYKNGMYPLMGALIGSVVGGPLGLLAGFKIGGLTAVGVGCGFLGFTGGKVLQNQADVSIEEAEQHREQLKT